MEKCGLSIDTLEFISAGIYSGLRIREDASFRALEPTGEWDLDWSSPHKIENQLNLQKLRLGFNQFANPQSWRLFLKNVLMFARNTIEEVHLQNCKLTNSQLIGIKNGFRDAVELYLSAQK